MKQCLISSGGWGRFDLAYVADNLEPRFSNGSSSCTTNQYSGTLGGSVYNVSISHRPNNKYDIFAVGTNNVIYYKTWENGAWMPAEGQWQSLDWSTCAPVTIVNNTNACVDIFIIGLEHAIWRRNRMESGSGPVWSGWINIGGHFHSAVAATSRSADYFDLAAVSTNLEIWYKLLDQPNSRKWDALGGRFKSQPVMVAEGSTRLWLLGLTTDNKLVYKYGTATSPTAPPTWTPAGKDWCEIGSDFDSPPAAAVGVADSLEIFAVDNKAVLKRKTLRANVLGDGGAWEDIGFTNSVGAPWVWNKGGGKWDVLCAGYDGILYSKAYTSGVATGWVNTGIVTRKSATSIDGFPPPYTDNY